MDFFHLIWNSSAIVKLVLLILIFCSFYSWALMMSKWVLLKKMIESDSLVEKQLQEGKIFEEIMALNEKSSFKAPKCELLLFGMIKFKELLKLKFGEFKDRDEKFMNEYLLEKLKIALAQKEILLSQKYSEGLDILACLGSLSPFIGLFGTVFGIVHSFKGLQGGGTGIDAIAPGIAEALIATALGLFVAIPSVFFFNYFSTKLQKHSIMLEIFNQYLCEQFERRNLLKKY